MSWGGFGSSSTILLLPLGSTLLLSAAYCELTKESNHPASASSSRKDLSVRKRDAWDL